MTEFTPGTRVRNADLYTAENEGIPLGTLGTVIVPLTPNGFIRVIWDGIEKSFDGRGWPVIASEIQKVED
jgi:hypothetical protein